jgi:cytochrome c oxidase subunit II
MVALESGESVLADEEFIRRSIVDPSAQITEGQQDAMPHNFAQSLKPNEIGWLVEFYKSYGAEPLEISERSEAGAPADSTESAANQEQGAPRQDAAATAPR